VIPDTPSPQALLGAALWYARHGWHVVPLHTPLFDASGQFTGCTCEAWKRGQPRYGPEWACSTPGKHPREGGWEEKATTDEATIRGWWKRWPNANVGIAAGKSGLVCLDLDLYQEGAGDMALTRAEQETVTNLTGGGGQHLIYVHPDEGPDISNADHNLPDWVNVRAHGGQFVAPPSLHPSGRRYEWEVDYGPHEREPAPLPDTLRELLQGPGGQRQRALPIPATVTAGKRHNTAVSLVGTMRRRGMSDQAMTVALLAENAERFEPPLPEDEIRSIVASSKRWEPAEDAVRQNGHAAATPAQVLWLEPESGAALYDRHFEPLVFLVDEMLAKGNFAVAAGRPKAGKSWLMLQAAQAVDTGRPFLGKSTKAASVLYVALEDGDRRIHQRLHLLGWKPKQTAFLFDIANFDGDGGPGPGLAQLEGLAADYDLIIIDTLIKTLSGRANENDNAQMAAIVYKLASISHEHGPAIVAIHHTGKGQSDDPFNLLRGASAIRGGYDLGLVLERKQGEREALLHVESRDFESSSMTIQQAEGGAGWGVLGDGLKLSEIRAGRKAAQAMSDHGDPLTAQELAKLLRITHQAAHKQLLNLERDGYASRVSETREGSDKPADVWSLL
jgi:hypothetical protein